MAYPKHQIGRGAPSESGVVRHDGAERRSNDRLDAACCLEDGGWPPGDGLQDQSSNRRALPGDEIPGGERSGKGGMNPSGMAQKDERK